jgi:hypothetical protein
MLSILIPIYNYNAYPLVKKNCRSLEAKIDFEILCQDDFSKYLQENQEINTLENCRFRNETNLGRGKT